MIENFTIRKANRGDVPIMLRYINELSEYEELEHYATLEQLEKTIFDDKRAYVLIPEFMSKPIGYVIYYYNYSTFLAKPGIYIEDIYIAKDMRNRGFGKEIFKVIADIAIDEDCGRIEWSCLNWNEPSLKFYEKLGAKKLSQWTTHRLEGDNIKALSHCGNSGKNT